MAVFRPFKAVRPVNSDMALQVAALPYDVMSSDEAREIVYHKPYSFLHIDKSEVDLSRRVHIYDQQVYDKARENLEDFIEENVFIQDEKPCFYIYRITMEGRSQYGVVGCASVEDYQNGIIRKHELTLEEKENDRMRHIDTTDANTGPIFLTYRNNDFIDKLISDWSRNNEPVYDCSFDEDGVNHTVWVINDEGVIKTLQEAFAFVPILYIADGHHRNASAVRVALKRRTEYPYAGPEAEFNFYLAVAFPSEQLRIFDYNRVVKGLNGLTPQMFLERLNRNFDIERCDEFTGPKQRHTFGVYIERAWYLAKARPQIINEHDIIKGLDVTILQEQVLSTILGIQDPRTDKRIDFVGGIRGYKVLSKCVDAGDADVAFAMFPTSMNELLSVADQYLIMPPKSTWFEPKLRSGFFVHLLNESPYTIPNMVASAKQRRAARQAKLQAEWNAARAEAERARAEKIAADAARAEEERKVIESSKVEAEKRAAERAKIEAERRATEAVQAARAAIARVQAEEMARAKALQEAAAAEERRLAEEIAKVQEKSEADELVAKRERVSEQAEQMQAEAKAKVDDWIAKAERAAEEARRAAENARVIAEQKAAEAQRIAAERRAAEAARFEAERRAAEAAKAAEEAHKAVEASQKAEEARQSAMPAQKQQNVSAAEVNEHIQNLIGLIADKLENCDDIEAVRKTIEEVRSMHQ